MDRPETQSGDVYWAAGRSCRGTAPVDMGMAVEMAAGWQGGAAVAVAGAFVTEAERSGTRMVWHHECRRRLGWCKIWQCARWATTETEEPEGGAADRGCLRGLAPIDLCHCLLDSVQALQHGCRARVSGLGLANKILDIGLRALAGGGADDVLEVLQAVVHRGLRRRREVPGGEPAVHLAAPAAAVSELRQLLAGGVPDSRLYASQTGAEPGDALIPPSGFARRMGILPDAVLRRLPRALLEGGEALEEDDGRAARIELVLATIRRHGVVGAVALQAVQSGLVQVLKIADHLQLLALHHHLRPRGIHPGPAIHCLHQRCLQAINSAPQDVHPLAALAALPRVLVQAPLEQGRVGVARLRLAVDLGPDCPHNLHLRGVLLEDLHVQLVELPAQCRQLPGLLRSGGAQGLLHEGEPIHHCRKLVRLVTDCLLGAGSGAAATATANASCTIAAADVRHNGRRRMAKYPFELQDAINQGKADFLGLLRRCPIRRVGRCFVEAAQEVLHTCHPVTQRETATASSKLCVTLLVHFAERFDTGLACEKANMDCLNFSHGVREAPLVPLRGAIEQHLEGAVAAAECRLRLLQLL
mmetsp:Transcript_75209/g.244564  ORF Transcript_75209/g.244564 Transcript_75209/m.244564 type:complete len:586 (+) Transcript_75209:313-2070(+)